MTSVFEPYSMRSPFRIVPARLAFLGSSFGSSECFSLPLSSAMSTVTGSKAENARAAALSAKVMAKRRSPTIIHIRLPPVLWMPHWHPQQKKQANLKSNVADNAGAEDKEAEQHRQPAQPPHVPGAARFDFQVTGTLIFNTGTNAAHVHCIFPPFATPRQSQPPAPDQRTHRASR